MQSTKRPRHSCYQIEPRGYNFSEGLDLECLWQVVGVLSAVSFSLWVPSPLSLGFPGGTTGKELPVNAGLMRRGFDPWVRKTLKEGKATRCSILAWTIPWTEVAGWLQSMGSPRVRYG